MELSEHAARNREVWNAEAPNWVTSGRAAWASPTPWWGMWHVPEEEVNVLPDVAGLDVVDLGCGTGYWCAWFAKLGARPVGLDLSEVGAAIWCDPYVWMPRAHRLLRPGGRLIFLCHSILDSLCSPLEDEPIGERLLRPERSLGRIDWPEPDGRTSTDFHQPHGERIKLLRDTGFELQALHELYAPDGPADEVRHHMLRGWAQQWPGEEVWVARRSSTE